MSALLPATDWLAARARLAPGARALVVCEPGGAEREVTYGAWDAAANRTARLLRDGLGVARGERVAVLAHNCAEQLDLLFACQKLGAVLVPLNWRLGVAELAALVADAAPAVLAYGPECAGAVDALRARAPGVRRLVALGAPAHGDDLPLSAREAHPPTHPGAVELPADAPWVLCGTGGSTGAPKLAILTHGAVTANAVNTVTGWGLSRDDVALLNAPLFHTGGLNVFTTPLVFAGGASVVCRGFDAGQVLELVARGRVSVLFGVPTMFLELQRHPRFGAVDFRRLKLVISGGAPCPQPVFERFFEKGVAFRTGYGLTEAGPNTFGLDDARAREAPGCVGAPLPWVRARLAGEAGPDAEAEGELELAGPHLFAGYWGREAESRAALTPDGWLRTGDVARRDAQGQYRIVGRLKELLISGGENVYPAEVEAVLCAHADVAEAAVIGVPDPKWGEVPRALVVLRPGAAPDEPALRAHCEARLARFKCPRSVRFLEALPRTGAGKVDRRALAAAHGH